MLSSLISENKANPLVAISSSTVGILYVNFAIYIQQNFLHVKDNACTISKITTLDLIYFTLSGIIITAIINLQALMFTKKIKLKTAELGLIGTGPFLAGISIICGACSLPILGLVGINTILNFLGQFQSLIKILSMILILIGLYLSLQQFRNKCVLATCKITK